jgi:crotonobetainyl-CoA:carnitine CoA-transferase CaiB-like acyl-CoA transferase
MQVLDWNMMTSNLAYKTLKMEQDIQIGPNKKIVTTRCPIRINGQSIVNGKAAPLLGQHNEQVYTDFIKQ